MKKLGNSWTKLVVTTTTAMVLVVTSAGAALAGHDWT